MSPFPEPSPETRAVLDRILRTTTAEAIVEERRLVEELRARHRKLQAAQRDANRRRHKP